MTEPSTSYVQELQRRVRDLEQRLIERDGENERLGKWITELLHRANRREADAIQARSRADTTEQRLKAAEGLLDEAQCGDELTDNELVTRIRAFLDGAQEGECRVQSLDAIHAGTLVEIRGKGLGGGWQCTVCDWAVTEGLPPWHECTPTKEEQIAKPGVDQRVYTAEGYLAYDETSFDMIPGICNGPKNVAEWFMVCGDTNPDGSPIFDGEGKKKVRVSVTIAYEELSVEINHPFHQYTLPRKVGECDYTFPDGGHCGSTAYKHHNGGHDSHGRGTAEDGPDDSDCICRGTEKQGECALTGCGFCQVAEGWEKD